MKNKKKTMKIFGTRLHVCLGLLLFLLIPSLWADEVVLNIRKGWGLYSLPLNPDANGTATLYSLKELWIWNGRKFVYPTVVPKPYMGFVVYSAEDKSVRITGNVVTVKPFEVKPGWCLLDHEYAFGTSFALREGNFQCLEKTSAYEQEAFWVFSPTAGFVYPFALKSTDFNTSYVPYWMSQDFELRATFQDGKTFTIPAQWSLNSENYATIEAGKVTNLNHENQDHTAILTGVFTINGETHTTKQTITLGKNSTYLVVDLLTGNHYTTDTPPNLSNDVCRTTELWLRHIPAGTFMMGSPTSELGHHDDEIQHRVTLTKDFYIGVFEVTQKQYELMMGDNPSDFKGDTRPVVGVSSTGLRGIGTNGGLAAAAGKPGADVSASGSNTPSQETPGWPQEGYKVDKNSFIGQLRTKTGLPFDLPTEAQWEYACRAGTTTSLNSGKNLTNTNECPNMAAVGRYKYNQSDGKGGYTEYTKVGSYLPNNWGLYDMHGNVSECCLDNMSDFNIAAVTDPVGGTGNQLRIGRGGDWCCIAQDCRSAYRRGGGIGVRVVVLPSFIESSTSLVSIAINGPDTIAIGETGTYTCTATWNNGMETIVSPKWSLSSTAYATISAGGKIINTNNSGKTQTVNLLASYTFNGITYTASKTITLPSASLTAIAINGPDSIAYNNTASYTCIATWSNGTTSAVSPKWSLSSTAYATLSANGMVTNKNKSGKTQTVTLHASYTANGVTKTASKTITLPSAPPSLTSIAINGPDSIEYNKTATYTCTATWSDGTTSSVTPKWSLSDTTYATVNASGTVTNKNTSGKTQTVVLTATYTHNGITKTASKTITLQPNDPDPGPGPGPIPSKTLRAISISGKAYIPYGKTETYICTAIWSDNSTSTVSPQQWSLSDYTYATLSGAGKVTNINTSGITRTVVLTATYIYKGITYTSSMEITLDPRDLTLTLISISISGKTYIPYGETEAYTCTAAWSDGSTSIVSPQWSLSSTKYATLSGNTVTNKNTSGLEQTVTLTATYTHNGVTRTATHRITLPTLLLDSIDINGPDSIAYGASATYTCIAKWNNGTTSTVSATWELSSTTYATLSGSTVTNKNTSGKTKDVTLTATYKYNNVTKTLSKLITLLPASIMSIAIEGKDTIASGATENYTCIATREDGTTSIVSPTWKLSSTTYATVSADGKVTNKNTGTSQQIVTLTATYKSGDKTFTATKDITLECPQPSGSGIYLVVNLQTGKYRYSNTGPNLDDDTCRTTEFWLRRIPAGTFTMGSPEGELGRTNLSEDLPSDYHLYPDGKYRWRFNLNYETQHQVTLTEDFYIGIFEITQKQYELITGTNFADPLMAQFNVNADDIFPAYEISYDDIRGSSIGAGWPEGGHAVDSDSILGKLRAKTGLAFDLPTEAQWEYACRAGTTTALNSGKNLTNKKECSNVAEVGRYRYNQDDGKGKTLYIYSMSFSSDFSKVGSYRPNAWGLYDMHGNVAEWCLDYYYTYEWCWDWESYDDPAPVINPKGTTRDRLSDEKPSRVSRGGSHNQEADDCRSAARTHHLEPNDRRIISGFRLVYIP